MITLYQFPLAFGLPNASPFCLKLELLYLRMTGLPYRNRYTLDLQRAPKGKLPWIDDAGTAVADSGLIVDYLKHKFGDPLDNGLTPLQRARALAITRLFEEHLYWAMPIWSLIVSGWRANTSRKAMRPLLIEGFKFDRLESVDRTLKSIKCPRPGDLLCWFRGACK